MDVNINLKDDTFFFSDGKENNYKKNNASKLLILSLNKKGIYTVNDLINIDQTKFNKSNAHYLRALVQIMRYRYLGEELINDVLLENEYTTSKSDVGRLAKDLRRLGFGGDIKYLRDKVIPLYITLHLDDNSFTMEQFLRAEDDNSLFVLGNADFRGFYLKYIEEMKKKKQAEENMPEKDILEELKHQLERLIETRDSIDKQIQDVQNQIYSLNGGNYYGR